MRFELPEINTWRLYNKNISQETVQAMVEAWESHGYRFGTVCIDDGWTARGLLGDWLPDPERFPDFAGMVRWIHDRGYAVRLWVAPAQMHADTGIYRRAFPQATLCDAAGHPSFYAGLGTYRLDPRAEIACEHIRSTLQRLIRDYDVDAFKVDFPPFYEPGDAFYRHMNLAVAEAEAKSIVPAFYRHVRESVAEIKPSVRICGAKAIAGCQAYLQDVISGDLIGCERSYQGLAPIAKKLRDYARGHDITPWLDMVWGEGSENPMPRPEWHAGYLENMALSINFELKLEHSFQPFNYPNARQIRALTNLYGPRNAQYKVLAAGRKVFAVADMMEAGIDLSPSTRFLVAPEADMTVVLHTAPLGTNALQWKARSLFGDETVKLRARNEYWGNTTNWCRVEFEARGSELYELQHEGSPDAFYSQNFARISECKS